MNHNQLLSAAVELALDLIEKNETFLPFAMAVSESGESVIYSPDSDKEYTLEQAFESVRLSVQRDLENRRLIGVAFCFHSRMRLPDWQEKSPAVEVELHFRGTPSALWYFPYKMEGKTAKVFDSITNDAEENLFA